MATLIHVDRIVKGKSERVPILVDYTDHWPDGLPILTIGTDWVKKRATGKYAFDSLELYTVTEFPTYQGDKQPDTPGRAFQLVKQSTGEIHHTFISQSGDEQQDTHKHLCSLCRGFMQYGYCKHVSALAYLVQAGLVSDPKEFPALATVSDDLPF